MNSYEASNKRALQMMNWQKENGTFSSSLEEHYRLVRRMVARAGKRKQLLKICSGNFHVILFDSEERKQWNMAVWGVVNLITFGLVALPVDEPPYELPERLKDENYRNVEKEFSLCKIMSVRLALHVVTFCPDLEKKANPHLSPPSR